MTGEKLILVYGEKPKKIRENFKEVIKVTVDIR